jgi:hypothetical protein
MSRFVETGTYVGATLADVEPDFAELYSIELGEDLYVAAAKRFVGHEKVHLLQGDSASVLPSIVNGLAGPALFWLDGHYSEGVTARGSVDTPIRAELETIFAGDPCGHVVLVDDARSFTGENDYPSINELRELVSRLAPTYEMTVRDDIVRLVPKV